VPIEWTTVVEGGIPILGGLYATALGYGAVSRSQPQPSPPVLKTRSLFRWLGPLVVLFGCFAAWQAHLQAMHPPAELIARQIRNRMKFPITLDDTTQLVGVEGSGDRLIYQTAIHVRLAELGGKERAQRELEAHLLKTVCESKDYETILRRGYIIEVQYSFQDSAEAVLISIPPRTCGY
jgi:hypothetical protein